MTEISNLAGHIVLKPHGIYAQELTKKDGPRLVALTLLRHTAFPSVGTLTEAIVDAAQRFQRCQTLNHDLQQALADLPVSKVDALACGDVSTCASWAHDLAIDLPEQRYRDIPALWVERINVTPSEYKKLIDDPPQSPGCVASILRRRFQPRGRLGSRWARTLELVNGRIPDQYTVLTRLIVEPFAEVEAPHDADQQCRAFLRRAKSRLQDRVWLKQFPDASIAIINGILTDNTQGWLRSMTSKGASPSDLHGSSMLRL